jgi:hypothetical protein
VRRLAVGTVEVERLEEARRISEARTTDHLLLYMDIITIYGHNEENQRGESMIALILAVYIQMGTNGYELVQMGTNWRRIMEVPWRLISDWHTWGGVN